MITKMTKYTFLMLKGDKEGFLEKLGELGVVDITRSTKPVDSKSSELFEGIGAHKARIQELQKGSDAKLEALLSQESALLKAEAEVAPWGEYDREALAALGVKFYCLPTKKFDASWEQQYAIQRVCEADGKIWFVIVGDASGFPEKEMPAPAKTVSELRAEADSVKAEIEKYRAILEKEKEGIPEIEKQISDIYSELDTYLAGLTASTAAEDAIAIFTGFAPTTEDARLKAAFDSMDIYYESEKAKASDNPPIKLKNNWFASQFESLTGMYGMPVYDEWDPTPILAPFYLLFFAFCMGDAGYGLILIAIGYALKGVKGSGPMGLAPYWKLIRTLGVGTFVVGVFLGTFFGISLSEAAWVPDWLKSVLLVGNIGQFPLQMVLALGIGVFHISLAMVVKSILYTKRFGFKSTISTWGWTVLIVGGIIALVLGAVAKLPADVTKWIIIAIAAVSVLGIFIFNKPGRNPLLNIGAGLWDTYQMATGILGDVLSYIRLYALGLAGGMLGSAFNTLGDMVLGSSPVTWIFFALIVLAGHALNLAMSCLGAFVHPLRLSFVEYFKNSGYEGRGLQYNPFGKTK